MASATVKDGELPLNELLGDMKAGLQSNPTLNDIQDGRARDREAVCTNVRVQMCRLLSCPTVSARVDEGELLVVGAFYEMSSGMVDCFEVGKSSMALAKDDSAQAKTNVSKDDAGAAVNCSPCMPDPYPVTNV